MGSRDIDVKDCFGSEMPSAQSWLIKSNDNNKEGSYTYSYDVKDNLNGRSVWAHIKGSSLSTRFVDALDTLEAILAPVEWIYKMVMGPVLSILLSPFIILGGIFLKMIGSGISKDEVADNLLSLIAFPIKAANRLAEIAWGLALSPVIVMIHLAINLPRWVSKACSKSLSADSIERNDNEAAELSDTELPQTELPQTEQFNQSAQDNDRSAEEGTFLFRRSSDYIELNYA